MSKLSTDDIVQLAPYMDEDVLAQIFMSSKDYQSVIGNFSAHPLKDYPTSPVEFMTETLGYQMWDKIEETLRSVQINHNTVVTSGFGTGKTVSAASIACWWMATYRPAIVITLAPTFSQVQNIIWRYIRAVGRRAGLPGTIYDTPRWEVSPDHYAVGLSPRKTSAEDVAAIQGYHGPRVLVIMDEAAGLPRLIWETVTGLAVGENCRILAIGNPIQQAGPFWDACNSDNWYCVRISDLDHPNVISGREIIPGAVSRQWIEDRAHDWATEVEPHTVEAIELPWTGRWYLPMPIFEAKVLGIAPEQSSDQLIRLSWVISAENTVIEPRNARIVAGFDPAPRGGDDNVLLIRYGGKVIHIDRRKSQDTQELASMIGMMIEEWKIDRVYIDDVGVGVGVTDRCRVMGLPVVAVNFGAAASQRKRFANLRAECWWKVREQLREGKLQLPKDNLLEGDLVAPLYGADAYGRILIEKKDKIRDRIKRSPDTGDALALSFAAPLVDTNNDIVRDIEEMVAISKWGENNISSWVVTMRRGDESRWKK